MAGSGGRAASGAEAADLVLGWTAASDAVVAVTLTESGAPQGNTLSGTPDPAGSGEAAKTFVPAQLTVDEVLQGQAPASELVVPVWLPGENDESDGGQPGVGAMDTGLPEGTRGVAFIQLFQRASRESEQPYQAVVTALAEALRLAGDDAEPALLLAWYTVADGRASNPVDGRALTEGQLRNEIRLAAEIVGP
jgi:hypothetical protein